MANVTVVMFNAGGGHRSATHAFLDAFSKVREGAITTVFDAGEALASFDPMHRLLGVSGIDIYNKCLRKDMTSVVTPLMAVNKRLLRKQHRLVVDCLSDQWQQTSPDAVVCVMPWLAESLSESVARLSNDIPVLIVLTDVCDTPPGLWFPTRGYPSGAPLYFAVPTEKAATQALAAGCPAERVFLLSGLMVQEKFYRAPSDDPAFVRNELALDPHKTTALVSFGAGGSGALFKVLRALEPYHEQLQLVALTGRDIRAAEKIRNRRDKLKVAAVEFTTDVPRFVNASDFVIGKPGGGTMGEVVVMGRPIVSILSRLLWEQENAAWLSERGLGISASTTLELRNAVEQLLDDDVRGAFYATLRAYRNDGAEEVARIVDALLSEREGGNSLRRLATVRAA